jgi:hypothetical protein
MSARTAHSDRLGGSHASLTSGMLTCVRGLIIFGLVVLAVGLVLIPLPGPGALLMALGGLLLVAGRYPLGRGEDDLRRCRSSTTTLIAAVPDWALAITRRVRTRYRRQFCVFRAGTPRGRIS